MKRRAMEYALNKQSHTEQMNDVKIGKTYGAGVALKEATKKANATLTATARNPKNFPKELQQCAYYHPLYCTLLDHNTASSQICAMKQKNKEEQKVILNHIKSLRIEEELAIVQESGKSWLQYVLFILLCHILKIKFQSYLNYFCIIIS